MSNKYVFVFLCLVFLFNMVLGVWNHNLSAGLGWFVALINYIGLYKTIQYYED